MKLPAFVYGVFGILTHDHDPYLPPVIEHSLSQENFIHLSSNNLVKLQNQSLLST